MKLRFENTIDDIIAFNRRFHESGPLVKQQARSMAITMFVLGWCIIFMANFLSAFEATAWLSWLSLAFAVVATSSLAITVYLLWKPYMLYNIGRAVRKLYKTQPDKVSLGPRELEITPGRLIERNDFGEVRWKISAIEQITSTDRYVFISISPMRAYILPRDCFHEDELEEFLDELDRAQTQQSLPPPLAGDQAMEAIQAHDRRHT